MKRTALGNATVDELVERFVRLCVEQGIEMDRGDVPRVNRLFDDIEAVKRALKLSPGRSAPRAD